jgi:5-methylcytosine-specific restriction endonuclease McrA
MARIRTIKPEFWESESVGRLSMPARLLFVASLNFADDEGLLRWNEAYLSSQAFVYDELSTERVRELMCELEREQIIFPYKAGTTNQRLAWIVCFKNHQVINRPQQSRLPHPSIQNPSFREAIYRRDRGICHICKEPIATHGSSSGVGSLMGSLDHIIPVSKGGTDYPSNLKTAHVSCNKSRGNKPITDSVNESVLEVEGKGKEGKLKPLSADADAYPPGFQKFWKAFPNTKRKGGRPECFKVWVRRKLESQADAIVAHVLAMVESADWQKNGGEFIPMPATYLNGQRWDGADLSAPPVGRDYGRCTWNLNGTREAGGRCEFRATALHPTNGMARCEHHIARN